MRSAFSRFLFSICVLVIILLAWATVAGYRIYFNPDARMLAEISASALVVFQDQGSICLFYDEQIGKVSGNVSTNLNVPLVPQPLYQSASCRAAGSTVTCSSVDALNAQRIKEEDFPFEPWLIQLATKVQIDPFLLQVGTYDVFLGENYRGRLVVTQGRNTGGQVCEKVQGTLELVIADPSSSGSARQEAYPIDSTAVPSVPTIPLQTQYPPP